MGLSPGGLYLHGRHGMVGKGLMRARISTGCGVRRLGPWLGSEVPQFLGSEVPQFLYRDWVSKDLLPSDLLLS